MNVSKELAQTVLKIPVKFSYIQIREKLLEYGFNTSLNELNGTNHNSNQEENYYNLKQNFNESINIFEFVQKCKIWAHKCGYNLVEEYDRIRLIRLKCDKPIQDFEGNLFDSKPVIEACEWLLKNKDM